MSKLGIKERELVQSKVIDVSHAGNSAQVLRLLKMYCEALNTGTSEGGTPMTSLLDETLSVYTGDIVLTRGAVSKIRAMFHTHGLQVDTLYSVSPQTQQAALDEGFFVRQRPEEVEKPIRTPLPLSKPSSTQLPPELEPKSDAPASEGVNVASDASIGEEVSSELKPEVKTSDPNESVASMIDFGQSIESIQARIKDQLEKSRQSREPQQPEVAPWDPEFLDTLDGWSAETAVETAIETAVEPSATENQPEVDLPPLPPAAIPSTESAPRPDTSNWDTVDAFIGFRTEVGAEADLGPSQAPSVSSPSPSSSLATPSLDTSSPESDGVAMDTVSDGQTLFIRQTLRSGRVIRYDGHVVIIGDVHAGSEVAATGDVIIWGELHGIAHAGMRGDNFAEIRALHIDAIQLRIGDFIARQPDRIYNHKDSSGSRTNPTLPNPEVARVSDGEIKVFQGI